MSFSNIFNNKPKMSKVVTSQELREKRAKENSRYKNRFISLKSTDADIWSSAFDWNEVARVSNNGSYRFKNTNGACQRLYDRFKTKSKEELFTSSSSVVKAQYEEFKQIVSSFFPEGMSLNDAINVLMNDGMYQMGYLQIKKSELISILDDWKPGSLDIEDDYWRVQLGDDAQVKFAQVLHLYNFFMRYYFIERDFINKISLSSVDEIQVSLDIHTEEISDENLAPWLSLRDSLIWKVRPVIKWVTQNDEVTRSLISKSDFQIDHSNNWVVIYRVYQSSAESEPYSNVYIMRDQPINKLTIKTHSGNNIETELLKINYQNQNIIEYMNSSGNESFTFNSQSSVIEIEGRDNIPLYMQTVLFDFVGSALNTPQTAVYNTSAPANSAYRWNLYFTDYSSNAETLKTIPYIKKTRKSQSIEVHQPDLASVAYSTISVLTYDGQQVTVIPFQLSSSNEGSYKFTAITDNIRFVDAVYVLGNKI